MSISRIGHTTTQSSTIAIPGTYAAGDLIFVAASRTNTTAATVPAGWVTLTSGSSTGLSLVVACKYAQSASEAAPTFTNAGILNCAVYRASPGVLFVNLNSAPNSGTSATVNYSGISNYRTGIDANWYLGFAAQLTTANALETPPTGMTNVNFDSITGLESAVHDTNGNQLSNWSSANVVLVNSALYRSAVIQISEMPYTFPSGGGFRPVNIRGGADQ